MIRHTVSFALRHDAGSSEETEFLDSATATLSAIPGVEHFEVSRQVSPQSAHTFQFAMTFRDAAAYSAYNGHPDHVEFVATRWQSEVSDFQELDFEPRERRVAH